MFVYLHYKLTIHGMFMFSISMSEIYDANRGIKSMSEQRTAKRMPGFYKLPFTKKTRLHITCD